MVCATRLTPIPDEKARLMHAPSTTVDDGILIEVKDLAVSFSLLEGIVPAVSGVSLEIKRRRTLGVVGESGSGKTVTALSMLRLMPSPPSRLVSGQILLHRTSSRDVIDLTRLPQDGKQIRAIRGGEIAMIFQE